MKYKYKTCSLCKKEKPENRNPYCKDCSHTYWREYRIRKKLKPNISLEGLNNFIKYIEFRNKWSLMDLSDIGKILFFYEIITTNINEFDHYRCGEQINMMYIKIKDYYNKKKS